MMQFRLAGTGGQGQILAAIILAEAAVASDQLYAAQSQSYGPESRGGASRAEVVISESPIDYPKVDKPDFLLCMSQQGFDKYQDDVAEDGTILVDTSLVTVPETHRHSRVVGCKITETARKNLGRQVVANIIALGLLVRLTEVVSPEAAKKAIANRVPSGTESLNLQAFDLGFELDPSLDCFGLDRSF